GEPKPSRAATRVGRAVAASFTPYGRMCWTRDSASAWVGMELDGTAVVRCAAPDVGGGQTSSLCAITAEVLGLDLDHVTALGRDSHFPPRAGTTTATRTLLTPRPPPPRPAHPPPPPPRGGPPPPPPRGGGAGGGPPRRRRPRRRPR